MAIKQGRGAVHGMAGSVAAPPAVSSVAMASSVRVAVVDATFAGEAVMRLMIEPVALAILMVARSTPQANREAEAAMMASVRAADIANLSRV